MKALKKRTPLSCVVGAFRSEKLVRVVVADVTDIRKVHSMISREIWWYVQTIWVEEVERRPELRLVDLYPALIIALLGMGR